MKIVRGLFYILVGVSLTLFLTSNFEQRVVVRFTNWWRTSEIPLALALFIAVLIGFIVTALLAIADQVRLRSRLRQQRRTIERLEQELGELRKLPLSESLPARSQPESRVRPDVQPQLEPEPQSQTDSDSSSSA